MLQTIEANWVVFAVAALLALLVALWLLGRATRASRAASRDRRPDVLDEGAAPAQRNQSLIDAPSSTAAAFAGTGPDILGGIGEVVAVAAAEEVAAVEEPAPAPAGTPAPTPDGEADDLRRIKGVGPKLVALLGSLGVTRYAQIAAWTEADIDRVDAQLGSFAGRVRRDSWVEQAKLLAADDAAGFEAKFGKL